MVEYLLQETRLTVFHLQVTLEELPRLKQNPKPHTDQGKDTQFCLLHPVTPWLLGKTMLICSKLK